jgi:hypothetical protein
MRGRSVVSWAAVAVVLAAVISPPEWSTASGTPEVTLVASYRPPEGDPDARYVRDRAWTYDAALTAAARTVDGDLDGGGAILDRLGALLARDGVLAQSYDIATERPDGSPRSGVMAWAGLAALEWRRVTCSGRHDALIDRVARWLLDQQRTAAGQTGLGLVGGGPGVSWVSTEHNLEARAFFAGLVATLEGASCPPGLDGLAPDAATRLAGRARDALVALDGAIERDLLVDDGVAHAYLRQGLGDDVRAADVQALGILWLAGRGRLDAARRVAAEADAALLVRDRTVAWPGAEGAAFVGYRPYAGGWAPDILWMEGTLQLRTAKARIGADTAELDASIARWAGLTEPGYVLQADRVDVDYHVWPAAAPAAWLRLSRTGFPLLSAGR